MRLVFAPEKSIAFFGGDPDNFEYPRYDLDVCFFRVYENDKPAKLEHFLAWNRQGAKENELVFVSGHPGRTDRQNTAAHLKFLRDVTLPLSLNTIRRREVLLKNYSDRSLENARRAEDELFGYQNSRKARLGQLAGLQDPALLKQLTDQEAAREEGSCDQCQAGRLGIGLERRRQVAGCLAAASFASTCCSSRDKPSIVSCSASPGRLTRMADETGKPNGERLREYRETNLESLEQQLFSEAPIYADLETAKLADSLGHVLGIGRRRRSRSHRRFSTASRHKPARRS